MSFDTRSLPKTTETGLRGGGGENGLGPGKRSLTEAISAQRGSAAKSTPDPGKQSTAGDVSAASDAGKTSAPESTPAAPDDGTSAAFQIAVSEPLTTSRPLTGKEIAYVSRVFENSVDYTPVVIIRDNLSKDSKTLGNTIFLTSDTTADPLFAKADGDMILTAKGLDVLVHEMTHVWQFQHNGLCYIPESLFAQLKAMIESKSGSRGEAYNWKVAYDAGLPWVQWNPEQQAAAIERYNEALDLLNKDHPQPWDDLKGAQRAVTMLQPYVDQVRNTGKPQLPK